MGPPVLYGGLAAEIPTDFNGLCFPPRGVHLSGAAGIALPPLRS